MSCLLIDTSGVSISLGAAEMSGRLFAATEVEHSRENSIRLPDLAKAMLESVGISFQQIEFVCVGCGPGSFIGTRTGVAFANGLASRGMKVLAVGSMETAAAIPSLNTGQVLVVRNARRHSVFAGAYRRAGGSFSTIGESEVSLDDLDDIVADAARAGGEGRMQLITDSKAVYGAAARREELRGAVVLKSGIVDMRGLAMLASERWKGASGAVDVRYLRSAV